MKKYLNTIDCTTGTIISEFSTLIIQEVAQETKIDPDDLAARVPGLLHSHWFVSEEYVDGCDCCDQIKQLNGAFHDSKDGSSDDSAGSG